MREAEGRLLREYRGTSQLSRLAIAGGVDKERGVGLTDGIDEFWQELMAGSNLHLIGRKCQSEFFRSPPAQTVVCPERVAVADNQDARHFPRN
jgi:hypothetical protein